MTPDKLLTLFKYYHGEDVCPFEERSNDAMWWAGEKMIYDQSAGPGFFSHFKGMLKEMLDKGTCSGRLTDESLSLDQRTIILYLDLWHGKWFPYDEWDVIETY